MYEAITMEYSSTRPVDDDVIHRSLATRCNIFLCLLLMLMCLQFLQKLNEFLLNLKALSPTMLQAARCLLTNQQGGDLAQMKITESLSSECKTVGAVVVHATIILFSNSKLQILTPFISMLENPASLVVRKALTMHSLVYIFGSLSFSASKTLQLC